MSELRHPAGELAITRAPGNAAVLLVRIPDDEPLAAGVLKRAGTLARFAIAELAGDADLGLVPPTEDHPTT